MLRIKLKEIAHSKYFACRPPDSGSAVFSEYGHVACQIKENHECSNMHAHILSSYTVLIQTIDPCGGGVKGQNIFVLKEVKLQLSLLYQDNCPLWGFCICSSICYAILCVGSSFTIILIKKRDLWLYFNCLSDVL